MAKANLPVNFKDDILSSGMSGKRRYNMIQNSDGTVSFDDVTDYTQVGSTFGAAQINATNEAVNNAADASKIIDNLDTIKANTQSGYIAGALAVKALDSNLGKLDYYEFNAKTGYVLELGYVPRLLFWEHHAKSDFSDDAARNNVYVKDMTIPGNKFYIYYDTAAGNGGAPSSNGTARYLLKSISEDGTLTFNAFTNYPYVKLWAMK